MNPIDFIEKFIEQRSTATLAEYKQVLAALADLRKLVQSQNEQTEASEAPAPAKSSRRIPLPGNVSDRDA